MAKITLVDMVAGPNVVSVQNSNNALLEAAIENTLSRDGTTPNTMEANLDLNTNRAINVGAPIGSSDAVRLVDLQAAAVNTDLPGQTGAEGRVLRSDGTAASWQNMGGATLRTSNYTFLNTDAFNHTYVDGAFSPAFLLPTSAGADAGWSVKVTNIGTGTVSVQASFTSQTLNGVANGTIYLESGESAEFTKTAVTTAYVAHSITRVPKGCSLYLDANQSHTTTATWEAINFAAELHDTHGFHDNVTNNSRITIPLNKGIRKASFWGQMYISATSTLLGIKLTKNGSSVYNGAPENLNIPGASTAPIIGLPTVVLDVADGDWFELEAYQSSGGPLNINGSPTQSLTLFGMKVEEQVIV